MRAEVELQARVNDALRSIESKDRLITEQSRVIRELRDLIEDQDNEHDTQTAIIRKMKTRLEENNQKLMITSKGRSSSHSNTRKTGMTSSNNDTSMAFNAVNRTLPTSTIPTDRLDLEMPRLSHQAPVSILSLHSDRQDGSYRGKYKQMAVLEKAEKFRQGVKETLERCVNAEQAKLEARLMQPLELESRKIPLRDVPTALYEAAAPNNTLDISLPSANGTIMQTYQHPLSEEARRPASVPAGALQSTFDPKINNI